VKFTHAESRLLTRMSAGIEDDLDGGPDWHKDLRRLVLLSMADAYPAGRSNGSVEFGDVKAKAYAIAKDKVREKYGFVLTLIMLAALAIIAEETLSWAWEKLLDWLWDKSSLSMNHARLVQLRDFQSGR
jgi:hypothetical protein